MISVIYPNKFIIKYEEANFIQTMSDKSIHLLKEPYGFSVENNIVAILAPYSDCLLHFGYEEIKIEKII